MKQMLLTFTLLISLFLCGCEEYEYTIYMKYDGHKLVRKVICSDNMPSEIRAGLQKLYAKRIAPNSYEGSFGKELPDDVGGFGRNLHMSNPMGDAYIYIERFRGNDAHAQDIEKAFDTTDHLVDLLTDWLEFELGSNANFEKLEKFCDEGLRADIKNLIIYMWMIGRIDNDQEEDLAVRMLLYLYERDYFTLADISEIVTSTEPEAIVLSHIRKLIAMKLEYGNSEETFKELAFLQDQYAVQQSAIRFLRSPGMYERILREARIRSGDPNLVIDPNSPEDFNDLVEGISQAYGIEPETFFFDLDIFGSNTKVNLKLDCPRKPVETNGEWDEEKKQVHWSSRITDDKLPFMCYAVVGKPNDEFQKGHFGRVILADEELVEYAFRYNGLKKDHREEWDKFIASLNPEHEHENRVESFRFTSDPVPDPNSNKEITLLSDLPRNLIIEGLRTNKKDEQE